VSGFACGDSICPTCGRTTECIIGPCVDCCDSHARTGRFLRRVPSHRAPSDANPSDQSRPFGPEST
jgi:hypothetical protein